MRNLSGGYKTYQLATQPVVNRRSGACGAAENCGTLLPPATGAPQPGFIRVDACGLQCPGPIMKLKQAVDLMGEGDCVEVTATDAGFPRDARAWCASTGNSVEAAHAEGGRHTVIIRKGTPQAPVAAAAGERNKTFIMFSDDLDRALATFVLANGAAATGRKVSIFFTFWGLNVIKKEHKPAVRKDIFGRMFSWMLPSDSRRLKLSKMSMLGIGDRMMRYIMRSKNIYSLEEMRRQALDNGVEFIACQMSMDMMGIVQEELLDGVTIGGVATYMERAEQANVNLFI